MVSVRIPLTQGKYAKVSIEDAERIMAFKWFADKNRKTFYAMRRITVAPKKQKVVRMHWMIAGIGCDHRNRDGLDNRRSNLREATFGQQMQNRGLFASNKSGRTGVYRRSDRGKWRAQISINGRKINLGTFERIEDAIARRERAEEELFGDFAAT